MRNGIKIREICPEDAAAFLKLLNRLDEETEFRAYEPGERKTTAAKQKKIIENVLLSGNSTILLAESGDKLLGYLDAIGGSYNRNKHSVHITIAILKEYTGKGIGKLLFKKLDEWALSKNIHRLELCVFTYNEPGIKLYLKYGYNIEGIKLHSFRVGDRYVDEYLMAKIVK